MTKLNASDLLRHLMEGNKYQVQDEEEALRVRALAKQERLRRGEERRNISDKKAGLSKSKPP